VDVRAPRGVPRVVKDMEDPRDHSCGPHSLADMIVGAKPTGISGSDVPGNRPRWAEPGVETAPVFRNLEDMHSSAQAKVCSFVLS
jgi:hypothetical protein